MNAAGRFLLLLVGASLAPVAAIAHARGIARNMPVDYAGATAAAPRARTQSAGAQYAQSGSTSAYDSIAVVDPANDATVFDNAGNVTVTVAVSPGLRGSAGDQIALILDGRVASVRDATRFKLSEIARGEHTLEAQIVDRGGTVVISSNPVKIYLWQASRLFPARRGK